jgi:D-3-phosphoglycerate dehydrogenase
MSTSPPPPQGHHRDEHALRQFDHHRRTCDCADVALARQMPEANASTHAGKWEKNRFMGVEVTGKTLGIIGCGNIGSIVADARVGLKMQVIAFDPFLSERGAGPRRREGRARRAVPRADFITLHTPLTDKTRNIIDADAIAKMKNGVRIINCARGGLIVEADALEGAEVGKVAGAALDVFEVEPATDNPLFGWKMSSHAASRRLDHRGAGERRAAGGRADGGLSDQGRGHQRAQHAVDHGRGSAAAEAVRQAGRSAGRVCRPGDRRPDQGVEILFDGATPSMNTAR